MEFSLGVEGGEVFLFSVLFVLGWRVGVVFCGFRVFFIVVFAFRVDYLVVFFL